MFHLFPVGHWGGGSQRLFPAAIAIAASRAPPTPITADLIRSFGATGIGTTAIMGAAFSFTSLSKFSAHHHPPDNGSCRSKASRRSDALFDDLAERFGCGRASAEIRAGGSFLIWSNGAAGMAAMASRICCRGSSGVGSAWAIFGTSALRRVSNTIFSGNLLADVIRMMVLSGSAIAAGSPGAGKYRSAANSKVSRSPPTKTKYRMIGMTARKQE